MYLSLGSPLFTSHMLLVTYFSCYFFVADCRVASKTLLLVWSGPSLIFRLNHLTKKRFAWQPICNGPGPLSVAKFVIIYIIKCFVCHCVRHCVTFYKNGFRTDGFGGSTNLRGCQIWGSSNCWAQVQRITLFEILLCMFIIVNCLCIVNNIHSWP